MPVPPYVSSDSGTQITLEWGVTPEGASSTIAIGTPSEGTIFSPNSYSYGVEWWGNLEWVSLFSATFDQIQPGQSYQYQVTWTYPYCGTATQSGEFTTSSVSCGCNTASLSYAQGVQQTYLSEETGPGGSNTLSYISEDPSNGDLVVLQSSTISICPGSTTEQFANTAGFNIYEGPGSAGYRFFVTGVTYNFWYNWTDVYSFYSTSVDDGNGGSGNAYASVQVGAGITDGTTGQAVNPVLLKTVAAGSYPNSVGPNGPSRFSEETNVYVPLGDTDAFYFTPLVIVFTQAYMECGYASALAGTGAGTPPTPFVFGSVQYRISH